MDSNCLNNGRANTCPYRSYYPSGREERWGSGETRRPDQKRRMPSCSMEKPECPELSCRRTEEKQMTENRCGREEKRMAENRCGRESRSKDDSCCMGKSGQERDMEEFALAMGYVPWQSYGRTFELCKGLEVGTIFPELCKPFCGKRGGCR